MRGSHLITHNHGRYVERDGNVFRAAVFQLLFTLLLGLALLAPIDGLAARCQHEPRQLSCQDDPVAGGQRLTRSGIPPGHGSRQEIPSADRSDEYDESSSRRDPGRLEINIRVYNYARVEHRTLARAQNLVEKVLDPVGVEVEWANCRLSAQDPLEDRSCERPVTARDVILRILPQDMAERFALPEAVCGLAIPSKAGGFGFASVFLPRVERLVQQGSLSLDFRSGRVLVVAHVMAHEIGHLLLRSQSHSRRGLMKRHWDKKDLKHAGWGALVFTPKQVKHIRDRLLRRQVEYVVAD